MHSGCNGQVLTLHSFSRQNKQTNYFLIKVNDNTFLVASVATNTSSVEDFQNEKPAGQKKLENKNLLQIIFLVLILFLISTNR